MRLACTLPFVCLLATGCSPAQSRPAKSASRPAAATAGAHTWQLVRTTLYADVPDPQFNYSMEHTLHLPQVTLLVPKGWTAQAGLPKNQPASDCASNYGRIVVQVSSPDHAINLLSLPGQVSFWSNNRAVLQQRAAYTQRWNGSAPCTIEEPKSLADSLTLFGPKMLKNGALAGPVEPVPGLSAELPQSIAEANRTLAQRGSRLEAEAGQVRIRGNQPDGSPGELRLIVLATHRFDPVPGGGFVELSDAPLFVLEGAPAGQLDPNQHLLDAVLNSIQISPEYTSYTTQYAAGIARIRQNAEDRVSQIYAQMAQDNANAAAQQAAIRRDASNYSSNVINSVSRNRAAALDHSSQQFALSMNDQALYHDGSGHTVQLPSQYGHVWASSTGNTNDYILTDSPSYNPNGNAGSASWTELQPVR